MQFPRPHMPYSFMRRQAEVVKRDNQLLIIILYRLQRSILTAHRLFIYQHVGGLQIYRTVAFPGDEVHLFFFGTSGIDIIACPEQLQRDKILQKNEEIAELKKQDTRVKHMIKKAAKWVLRRE